MSRRYIWLNFSPKNLLNSNVIWECCFGSEEFQAIIILPMALYILTSIVLFWEIAKEQESILDKSGLASGVLEKLTWNNRSPAYNPETFPHCPRRKNCRWLESFGNNHMFNYSNLFNLLQQWCPVMRIHVPCRNFSCFHFLAMRRRNPTIARWIYIHIHICILLRKFL